MMPTLFSIGSFELRIYSLMIIIALIIGIYFMRRRAVHFGIKPDVIENITVVLFVSALLGARLYYVFLRWDFYGANPSEIIAIWHGGLAIHGGVIGGIIGGVYYSWKKKVSPYFTADAIAPWLLFGQGLGRLGNFANGEAHGVPTITPPELIFRVKPAFLEFWSATLSHLNLSSTPESVSKIGDMIQKGIVTVPFEGKEYILKEYVPWGISFTSKYMPPAYLDFGTLAVHPTFFYEMILNFIGAAIMYYFWRKDNWVSTGAIFGMYLIAYGVIRAFVTYFRADDLMVGFLRAPHLASIAFVVAGLFLLITGRKKALKRAAKGI